MSQDKPPESSPLPPRPPGRKENDIQAELKNKEPDQTEPLQELDARLRRARGDDAAKTEPDSASAEMMSGYAMAFRIGTELVAALIVGVGIGLLLDKWLETAPLFLVVFFFLGAGAGILNVYRAASSIGLAPGYRPPGKGTESGDGRKDGPE